MKQARHSKVSLLPNYKLCKLYAAVQSPKPKDATSMKFEFLLVPGIWK